MIPLLVNFDPLLELVYSWPLYEVIFDYLFLSVRWTWKINAWRMLIYHGIDLFFSIHTKQRQTYHVWHYNDVIIVDFPKLLIYSEI